MSVALINPDLVVQRDDTFTTGIVYMPIGLAYVAASLRAAGLAVDVVDAFGAAPRRSRHAGKFLVLGLDPGDVLARLPEDCRLVFVYANQLINHVSLVELISAIKAARPGVLVCVLENTQAVTAYALNAVAQQLLGAGADCLLTGEAERRSVDLARAVEGGAVLADLEGRPGVTTTRSQTPPGPALADLDALPAPAWDLFPLENYWSLGFAHGPKAARRYLPLLTSRGCPYPCRFCVVPATNNRAWRARSAESVVDEMAAMQASFGVSEFHIEDLNPTIDDRRIRRICELIVNRGLAVTWKIAAGTKVESIKDLDTLELMARSGCRYISISPETGSARVLQAIGKPFDREHTVRLVHGMGRLGIRSQACFVLGFPGETAEDRELTARMVHDLTREGVDEIALFIISPVPGAEIFDRFEGYRSLSDLNFSPSWRSDYAELSRFRLRLYRSFLLWKLRYHPLRVARQAVNFLMRRFETKMEMVPYKALVLKALDLRLSLAKSWSRG